MTTTSVPATEEKPAPSTTAAAPSQQSPSTGLPTSSSAGVPPSPRLRQISAASAVSNVRRPSSSLSDARDPSSSRRHSEQRMLPPPAPLTQPPFAQPPSPGGSIRSVSSISGSEAGVNGPGPARLPRQLSPAEIHAELEKEQEAAVNRLTRQLSILRAQQAVSPTSHPISDDLSNTYPSTYLSPRSRRTSSNASTALTNAATIGSTMAGSSLSRQSSIQSLSAARGDPSAAPATPATSRAAPIPMSRQSSVRSISGSRASGRNSPALGESDSPYPYFSSQYYYASPHHPPGSSWKDSAGMVHMHNHHYSRERGEYASSETGGSERGLGVSYGSSTGGHPRYEEVLTARNELENVKKENEKLKEKIRELEKALSGVNVNSSANATASGSKEPKAETEVKSGEP